MTKPIKNIDFKRHVLPVLGGTARAIAVKTAIKIDVFHPVFDEHDVFDAIGDYFRLAADQSNAPVSRRMLGTVHKS